MEATLRRDKRVTISPSPPLLYLPLTTPPLPPPVSAVTSLPGYTGPQGDLILAWVPQCRSLSSPSAPPAPPRLYLTPPPPSFSGTFPRGTTVRPSSPELSISASVYLRRDSPTHLECIFTSVHALSPRSLIAGAPSILAVPPAARHLILGPAAVVSAYLQLPLTHFFRPEKVSRVSPISPSLSPSVCMCVCVPVFTHHPLPRGSSQQKKTNHRSSSASFRKPMTTGLMK